MNPASVWMRSNSSPGMMSSGMTVSSAVILRPELFGTGLGAGEMVRAGGTGLADFFMRDLVRVRDWVSGKKAERDRPDRQSFAQFWLSGRNRSSCIVRVPLTIPVRGAKPALIQLTAFTDPGPGFQIPAEET